MLYKRDVLLIYQMGYFDNVEHMFIPTHNEIQSGSKLDISYFVGMHARGINVIHKRYRFMVSRTIDHTIYYCSFTTQNSERTFFHFMITSIRSQSKSLLFKIKDIFHVNCDPQGIPLDDLPAPAAPGELQSCGTCKTSLNGVRIHTLCCINVRSY